jgi:hypothetical protein
LNGSGSASPTSLWALEVNGEVVADSVGVKSCGVGEGVMSSTEVLEVVLARTEVLDESCVIWEVMDI